MSLESFEKKNENKRKMLRGWCSFRVLPRFGSMLNKICSGYMTRTCWDILPIFHNKFGFWCGRPQCLLPPFAETCPSNSSISIRPSPPSPLSKPPRSSRLRVLFFVSCVMSIYLSIDFSCHFFARPASNSCCWLRLLYHCYTPSRRIIT